MKIKIATTSLELEQARRLINEIFLTSQPILKDDCELITPEYLKTLLATKDTELIILCINNKVLGTAVLQIASDAAYVSYLTRDNSLKGRGYGKNLMNFSENRAKKVYFKDKLRISTVYHPKYNQKAIENWYTEKLGYRFLQNQSPKADQQQLWKLEYQAAIFKCFEKSL